LSIQVNVDNVLTSTFFTLNFLYSVAKIRQENFHVDLSQIIYRTVVTVAKNLRALHKTQYKKSIRNVRLDHIGTVNKNLQL